jgi:hypothetical protein
MKIVRAVPVIEVKRCYVISNLARPRKSVHKSPSAYVRDFHHVLAQAKKKVLAYDERQVDQVVAAFWKKRLKAYNAMDWFIADISPHEVGLWRRAGDLPLAWTNRTLADTVDRVKASLTSKRSHFSTQKIRAGRVVQSLLGTQVNELQHEKYLFPIAFKGGTGTKPRRYLRFKTAYDIDDGCMRSLALALNGASKIRMYLGLPKKK